MKKQLLLIGALIFATAPLYAKTPKTEPVPAGTSAPVAVPVSSSVPIASTAPIASAAPAADAAPAVTAKPTDLSPDKLVSGNLTFTGMRAKYDGATVIFTATVANAGKGDDRLMGASVDAGDITQPSADGKQENPVDATLKASDKTDITLHVKNLTAAEKKSGVLALTLYFRSAPNTKLKVALGGGESIGAKIMDIFK
jgi:hypothetical protein